ncbi:MAG: phosphate signaling complex protein PhoU [Coriobacteriales bacterium]|jgi:phosphate transport system protein|nr:phosphate signaling complex protein PhoU [Coriobacteriales bacterium]
MALRFSEQLDELNQTLTRMASFVEQSIADASRALRDQDIKLAEQIIKADDEIDSLEKQIESFCLQILLLHHPVASDLRYISSILKVLTDLERIGDQAADISEISILLAKMPRHQDSPYIFKMAELTQKMVIDCIDAFIKQDIQLAEAVIYQDDEVDRLFQVIKDYIFTMIRTNAQDADLAVDYLVIAKYFERIGDHATNIAEWAIFAQTGVHKKRRII